MIITRIKWANAKRREVPIVRPAEKGDPVLYLVPLRYVSHSRSGPISTCLDPDHPCLPGSLKSAPHFAQPETMAGSVRVVSVNLNQRSGYGPHHREWTHGDLKLWAEWLNSKGILRHGAKAELETADTAASVTLAKLGQFAIPQIDGIPILRDEYATLSNAVHGSAKGFRMTKDIKETLLWSDAKDQRGKWGTRESTVVAGINLTLLAIFRKDLTGASAPSLRDAVGLALPASKFPDIKTHLQIVIRKP
jgi:hypothetical protein